MKKAKKPKSEPAEEIPAFTAMVKSPKKKMQSLAKAAGSSQQNSQSRRDALVELFNEMIKLRNTEYKNKKVTIFVVAAYEATHKHKEVSGRLRTARCSGEISIWPISKWYSVKRCIKNYKKNISVQRQMLSKFRETMFQSTDRALSGCMHGRNNKNRIHKNHF